MTLIADLSGERLDGFLSRALPDLSRSAAQKLLEQFPHISTPAEFDPDAFLTGFIDYFHSPQTQAALRTFPPTNPAGFRQLPGCEMNLITACTLKKL